MRRSCRRTRSHPRNVGEKFVDETTFYGNDSADELRAHSTNVRGIVLHALVVLVDLQVVAGRLNTVASLREVKQEESGIE